MFIEDTSDHYQDVRGFMEKAGQTVRDKPTIPTEEERLLRARLILEEALETIEALGFTPTMRHNMITMDDVQFFNSNQAPMSLEDIADGCADLSVVTVGTLIACGIPDIPLLRLVDSNNLAKFGPGGHRDENGKWIKPPGHKPPDIAGLLKELGGT
jgi:predicted HAD superfamily Cof-like phosphohydrolase